MNPAAFLGGALYLLLGAQAMAAGPVFNLAVAEDGHYRVAFEDLGLAPASYPLAGLRLTTGGISAHFEVEGGGDDAFGPGDALRFAGRRLPGQHAWYHPYSRHNVYRLHLAAEAIEESAPAPRSQPGPVVEHLEQERLRVALPEATEAAEPWYWQRITHVAGDNFRRTLEFAGTPDTLRIALAGLSRDVHAAADGVSQHHVEVLLDGAPVGEVSWDGQEAAQLEVTGLGGLTRGAGTVDLEIRVPSRQLTAEGSQIIDAVLLNWIEVTYTPGSVAADRMLPDGPRYLLVPAASRSPANIFPAQRDAQLAGGQSQADYLMLGHASLLDALQPLAEHHRKSGLSVAVVDVQAVYDEFNHGIASPQAIRRFVAHATRAWRPPAPRFLLLAGDASWARDPAVATRNLVPTLHVPARGQLAASDNGLVTVTGNDWRPDLAVGRLPAGNADELSAMIEKLLGYATNATGGEWRNRAVWISDGDADFQAITEELAHLAGAAGVAGARIYPEDAAEVDQQRVIEAFDDGSALVHFLGHGGRFVWRTGPRDLRGARDLFSVDTLQLLSPTAAQPLVLSMTCSSGPFDHPTETSIAEAFLLAADRGAVGVFAASWRVPPSRRFSTLLVEELLKPGARVGEAVMRAKRAERRRGLVESYNLLGDPALVLTLGVLP